MLNINETYSLARSGDKSAEKRLWEQLLVSFRVIVQQRVWVAQDGEEIVQEALMTILGKYKEIDIESSFAGWAHKVLSNKIMDYVKLRQIRTRRMGEYEREQVPSNVPAADPILRNRIKKCFARINRSHKQHARILNLRFQGYSTDEICKRLNITPNNCYVSLSRARDMLEACLSQEDENT